MTASGNGDSAGGVLEVTELANGQFAWTWTSPSGAFHQSPKHYKRRGDARKAGRQWLVERELPR
jgi:hypothetical protein